MSAYDTRTEAQHRANIVRGLGEVCEASVVDTVLALLSQAAGEAALQLWRSAGPKQQEAWSLAKEVSSLVSELDHARSDLYSALDAVGDEIEEEARRLQAELSLPEEVPGAEITTDLSDPTGYGPGIAWD